LKNKSLMDMPNPFSEGEKKRERERKKYIKEDE
jgi:hypothetical protein